VHDLARDPVADDFQPEALVHDILSGVDAEDDERLRMIPVGIIGVKIGV
jgi:hypothetical protein